MLFNCAQEKAIQYLGETLEQVASMGEILQLIVVELIRKICRTTTNPTERVYIFFYFKNFFKKKV